MILSYFIKYRPRKTYRKVYVFISALFLDLIVIIPNQPNRWGNSAEMRCGPEGVSNYSELTQSVGEFFYQPLLGKDLGAQIDTPLKNIINLAPNREKHIALTLTQQTIDTPQRKI